jgi:hypothetical protein
MKSSSKLWEDSQLSKPKKSKRPSKSKLTRASSHPKKREKFATSAKRSPHRAKTIGSRKPTYSSYAKRFAAGQVTLAKVLSELYERQSLLDERERLLSEREALLKEREEFVREREAFLKERQEDLVARERLVQHVQHPPLLSKKEDFLRILPGETRENYSIRILAEIRQRGLAPEDYYENAARQWGDHPREFFTSLIMSPKGPKAA